MRWLAIGYGLCAFIWLSLEDVTVWPVTLLGIAGAMLILISVTQRRLGERMIAPRWLPPLAILGGALVGLGSRVLMVALMFFKNAWHAHIYPDYTPQLMLATLQSALLWALAGALIGLSLALAYVALRPEQEHDETAP